MHSVVIAIDEAGTLEEGNFVYGGYLFIGKQKAKTVANKYKRYEQKFSMYKEVKANMLNASQQISLIKPLANQYSFAIKAPITIAEPIVTNKIGKQIFKDEMIVRVVRQILFDIPNLKQIKNIELIIDEQNLASNLQHNLYLSLYQQLICGYYEQQTYYKAMLTNDAKLNIKYVDSRQYSLVRAADLLANYVYNYHQMNDIEKIELNLFISL